MINTFNYIQTTLLLFSRISELNSSTGKFYFFIEFSVAATGWEKHLHNHNSKYFDLKNSILYQHIEAFGYTTDVEQKGKNIKSNEQEQSHLRPVVNGWAKSDLNTVRYFCYAINYFHLESGCIKLNESVSRRTAQLFKPNLNKKYVYSSVYLWYISLYKNGN